MRSRKSPPEGLRPIGEIVAEMIPKLGKRAIRHHLDCASTATGEVARKAFDQANGIRLSMELSWPQVFVGDDADDNINSIGDRGAA